MARTVVTVTEDTPVMDLVHLLQERHLIRVPVVKGVYMGVLLSCNASVMREDRHHHVLPGGS